MAKWGPAIVTTMRAILLALLLLAPLAMASHAETRQYVGTTHPTTARVVACQVPEPFAVNGACFRLSGQDSHVVIDVADVTGLPLLVQVFMQRPGAQVGEIVFTCDGRVEVDIPAEAQTLWVWFPVDDGIEEPPYCPLLRTQAMMGTITATFS